MKLRLIPPGEFDMGATPDLLEEHLKATPVEKLKEYTEPRRSVRALAADAGISGVAQADV